MRCSFFRSVRTKRAPVPPNGVVSSISALISCCNHDGHSKNLHNVSSYDFDFF